jgi:hypothetical protein
VVFYVHGEVIMQVLLTRGNLMLHLHGPAGLTNSSVVTKPIFVVKGRCPSFPADAGVPGDSL